MIKAAFSIFLLAIIFWVSFLKVSRDHERTETAYAAGRQDAGGELAAVEQEAESLRIAMGERELAFGETLMYRDAAYQAAVDSLADEIDTLQTELERAEVQLKSARKTASKPSAKGGGARKETGQKVSQHERILAYYNQRYKNLPGDLSTYEQKVAVAEIREETARKFSISLIELNRIRAQHKLDY